MKKGTIHPPELPKSLPSYIKWLSGQGAGAWFCIDSTALTNEFRIRRFTPTGQLDCDRIFGLEDNGLIFDINEEYHFTHISHCAKCKIIQKEQVFTFNYKGR